MGVEINKGGRITQPGHTYTRKGDIGEVSVEEVVGAFPRTVRVYSPRLRCYLPRILPAGFLMTTILYEDENGGMIKRTETRGIRNGESFTTPLGTRVRGI